MRHSLPCARAIARIVGKNLVLLEQSQDDGGIGADWQALERKSWPPRPCLHDHLDSDKDPRNTSSTANVRWQLSGNA